MDSEEHWEENRAIYNVILVTVTILGLACGVWLNLDTPTPPAVRLNNLSASYTLKKTDKYDDKYSKYPQQEKYDDTTFYVNITVRNNDTRRAAELDYVDVWVNARARTFLRIRLGQTLSLKKFTLKPEEEKVMEVKVSQDRPIRSWEWEKLLVSVFVRAKFPGAKDIFGHDRTAHKTRDCANLNATLHKANGTAAVEGNPLMTWCDAPY